YMQIRKANGTIEEFDEKKLIKAISQTGAKIDVAYEICQYVKDKCHQSYKDEPIRTDYIYRLAFKHLKNVSKASALKFSLKRSMLEIGPSGFPFEKFLAEIWKREGYSAITGQMVYGGCVSHEVDVIAWKEDELVMVEAKFHSDAGSRTDLKNALYVKARYDDIDQNEFAIGSFDAKATQGLPEKMAKKLTEGWLITNTYFSDTAITYANCNNLKLMSFDYPDGGALQDKIIEYSLYPITCLTTINHEEKNKLIQKDIILCQTLHNQSHVLTEIGIDKDRMYLILEEVSTLL
ncbi:ATPase, partial [Candidatus Parcubacteria bacterium]|nr:ATPase [Candidatus Parcubacteria bacterium]